TYEIRYQNSDENNQFYLEYTTFVVADGNVAGLELKALRGASVSGVVVFDGTLSQALRNRMNDSGAYFIVNQKIGEEEQPYVSRFVKTEADGKFRVSGLPPGTAFPYGFSYSNDLQITRIEHNGVDASRGIAITAGQKITGVRIVLAEGKG